MLNINLDAGGKFGLAQNAVVASWARYGSVTGKLLPQAKWYTLAFKNYCTWKAVAFVEGYFPIFYIHVGSTIPAMEFKKC